MEQRLTQKEIDRIQKLCFENPPKSCDVAQLIIDTCQVVSCSTYAKLKGKSKRTIQYQSGNLTGLGIETRKFLSINQ